MNSDVVLHLGDCRDWLHDIKPDSIDACVTDPPYELAFMGKKWDKTGVAFDHMTWWLTHEAMKPGGYLLAFGGTRTYHRLTCAIEDAGFEIRDCIMWLYGKGFPPSKGSLKPAYEPIVMARKHGKRVLPLSIDECRIPLNGEKPYSYPNGPGGSDPHHMWRGEKHGIGTKPLYGNPLGRWPANVCHDGSEEVTNAFREKATARFFYCAKTGKSENHPTIKPLALMEWLVKLICPPNGLCLDPFAGSGTTAVACLNTNRRFTGCELSPDYHAIALKRIAESQGALFAEQPSC